MPSNLTDAASAPAALSAFLRGIERRGALFAELQCGDPEAGDAALAASMRAFRTHAGTVPMADWPRRFWALLVANPQLRQTTATAAWPTALQALAALEPSLRQALLLRLAASLPEVEAAAVLGVDATRYEQALAAACPRDAEDRPDAMAWRALAETIQQRLRDLPPQRLARLAALREAAIRGSRLERSAAAGPAGREHAHRSASRRWPWVVLVVVLCLAALAATWWWPQLQPTPSAAAVDDGVRPLQEQVDIRSELLPAQDPASRFDAASGLLMHPDFELLSQVHEESVAQQADFLAWIAGGAGSGLPATTPADDATNPPPAVSGTETSDAQF